MRYLFFLSIVATGLYALVTGPRQIELAMTPQMSVEEKIRRMDEMNSSFAFETTGWRIPASINEN